MFLVTNDCMSSKLNFQSFIRKANNLIADWFGVVIEPLWSISEKVSLNNCFFAVNISSVFTFICNTNFIRDLNHFSTLLIITHIQVTHKIHY